MKSKSTKTKPAATKASKTAKSARDLTVKQAEDVKGGRLIRAR
jgi:hypothetical protein